MKHVIALLPLSVLLGGPSQPPQLEARFIGQMAVSISDGSITVITDFPYRVGYAGAPRFDAAELVAKTPVLALITHRHLDHWEPSLFAKTNWRVAGPADVTAGVSAERVVPLASPALFGTVQIEALETPHAGIGHYSYVVTWHGRRLYVTGDTESADALLATKNLDVAFVSPWLYESIQRRGGRIDARRVVIYHHQQGQRVSGCEGRCLVPRPNEGIAVGGQSP